MGAFLVLVAALMEGPGSEIVFAPISENSAFHRPGDGPAFTSLAPGGTLVIVGGANTPPEADAAFLAAAKSGNNHLIVIPTAATASDKEALSSFAKAFEGKVGKVTVLHAKDRAQALEPDFAKAIANASAVWIGGGDQKRLAERYANTPVETELKALLVRGGAVGGTSAGAAILSQTMIAGGNPQPEIQNGLGLVRGLVIDQHFTERNRAPRLKTAIGKHPDQVGLGIDESTAVILHGRDLRVVGKGKATWMVAEKNRNDSRDNPIHEKVLPTGTRDDLVRLFRETLVARETKPRGQPAITKGSVMAVGGGGMGADLAKKFVELAGGPDALIVILPTAAPEDSPVLQGLQAQRMLGRGGATHFKVLTGTKREEVESKEYLETLAKAKGVWFGGGRQWRFVDAYEGTKFEQALKGVLERGGVIGGSSAGATILGDYLCRGSPLGNTQMMTPGYEKGFAFLPGVGIDQHFSQRKRFADMEAFCKAKPEFVGVGIDEATALIATPKGAEALGPGKVHLYLPGRPAKAYASGEQFLLAP